MGKKLFLVFLLLFVFVLFSGCLDPKKSTKERLLCIELTSQAFAVVPNCSSQQDCFNRVNSAFFGFDESFFSYSERQKLFEHKNNVALAWLYYNNALQNISKARTICMANSGYFALPQQLNELNFNLSKAFESLDAANRSAFALMLLQQTDFEQQEVSLIKEEPLFDDFVLLSENLNQLQQNNTKKDNSLFVGKYFSLVSEFDSLSKALGFKAMVLNEINLSDFFGPAVPVIIKKAAGNSFFVPLLSNAVSGILNSVLGSIALSGSVSALKSFPSFQFALLFGRFSGAQNSLENEFGSMQKIIALHWKEASQKNSQTEQEILSLFSALEKKISEIDSESYASFDQNLLAELYSLLGNETQQVSPQRFSLAQISTIKQDAVSELEKLKSDFWLLKQKSYFSEISFGKKISQLKELLLSAETLNENLDFFHEETVVGLENLCESRISQIESKLSGSREQSVQELLDLGTKTSYFLHEFKSVIEKEKRLYYCRQTIESFNSFEKASENYSAFEESLKANTKDCFVFLEKLFNSSDSRLSGFQLQYSELKKLVEKKQNIQQIKESCVFLKSNIESFLQADEKIITIQNNFSKSDSLIAEITALKNHYPELFSEISLSSLERKKSSLEKYFFGQILSIENAITILPELAENSSSLLQESETFSREMLLLFFKQNSELTVFPVETAELGKQAHARIRLVFYNPFETSFVFPLSFAVPFKQKNISLVNYSENVLSARSDSNKLFIDLAFVPKKTFLELDSNFVVDAIQSQSIVSFSNEKATIKNSLDFSSPFNIAALLVELPLAQQGIVSEAFVLFNEKEIPVSLGKDSVSFLLDKIENNSTVELFYSIVEPFSVFVSLKELQQLDKNSWQYAYSIILKNNLALKLENQRFFVPLPTERTLNVVLRDSLGKQKSVSIEKNGFYLSLPELFPKQSTELVLSATVFDYLEYWNVFFEQTKQLCFSLSLSQSKKISEKAKELLLELDSIPFDSFSGAKNVSLLVQARQDVEKLSVLEKAQQELSLLFFRQKEAIEKELLDKTQELSVLTELGNSEGAARLSLPLSNAKALFDEALANADISDFNFALEKLAKAKSILSASSSNSLNSLLLKERDSLLKEKAFSFSGTDTNRTVSSIKDEALFFDSQFLSSLAKNDSNSAIFQLKQLGKKAIDLNFAVNASVSEKVLSAKEKIGLFQKLLSKQGIVASIDKLQELLRSVSDSELEQVSYVLPVSMQFLEKLRLKLVDFDSAKLQKKFSEFNQLLEQGDNLGAFSLLSGFEAELNQKTSELESINDNLENALLRAEQDAIIAVANAKKLLDSSSNTELKKAFDLAQKELSKKNFFKAIVLARGITDSFSANNNLPAAGFAGFSLQKIPLAVYPLAAVIAVVIVFRLQKNNSAQQKQRLQKLLRNH